MNAAERRPPRPPVFAAALCAAALLSPAAASAVPADVAFVSYSSAPAAIDASTNSAVLFSWSFTPSISSGHFRGYYLRLNGDVPPQQVLAGLYRDSNDNGILDVGTDVVVSSGVPFSGGGAGFPATVNVYNGAEEQTAPTRYFVTADWSGLPGGRKISFSLLDRWDLFLDGDNLLSSPPFPIKAGPSAIYIRLEASPDAGGYPVPTASPAYGGLDTGIFLSPGQRLQVSVPFAIWNVGGGGFDANGDGGSLGGLGPFPRAALVGRVGGGPWFLLGMSTTVTVSSQGTLFLAANDSDGNWSALNNLSFQRVALEVLASTSTKIWQGGTFGFETRADIDQNWLGGGRPRAGEKVWLDASDVDCDWNIPNETIAELVVSTEYAGRLRLTTPESGGRNELRVSSRAVIGGGRFAFEPMQWDSHRLLVDGTLVVKDSATLALDHGRVAVRDALELSNGAFLALASSSPYTRLESAAGFQGRWNMRVERATMSVTARLPLDQLDGIVFDRAALGAFDFVEFFPPASSSMPYATFLSPTAVSYAFRQWFASGSTRPVAINAVGVPSSSNISFYDSDVSHFGSPRTSATANTVFWFPDGGGAQGSISGTLNCAACPGVNYTILAASAPGVTMGVTASTGPGGAFTLAGLNAPGTYYLYAFANDGSGRPAPHSPRGGHGHDGYMISEPVYLPSGGAPTGKDVNMLPWAASSGTVSNPTGQTGTMLVETWDGPPYAVTSTRVAQGYANPWATPSYTLETLALAPGPVRHSSHVIVYVDSDGDFRWDAFEASGTASADAFSPAVGSTAGVSHIAVAGGGNAPGGVLALSSAALHVGAIAQFGDQPVLRLTLANSGADSRLSALNLRWTEALPASTVTVAVWEDEGDGSFSNMDYWRGSVGIGPAGPSSATAVFSQQVGFAAGQSKSLFVTVYMGGQRPPSAGVSIDTSAAFGMAAGSMANQVGAPYPAATGPLAVRVGVPANEYATPEGNGGSFTGLPVAAGQSLVVLASGTWRTGPGESATGPAGQAGTTGLNTVLPSANLGELIGRVGCSTCPSNWFRVGGGTMPLPAPQDGELRLAMNDYVGAGYDNVGTMLVDFGVLGSTTGVLQFTLHYATPAAGPVNVTAYRQGVAVASQPVTITAAAVYASTFPALPPGEYTLGAQNAGNANFGSSAKSVTLAAGATAQIEARMYQGVGQITGALSYAGVLNYGLFFVAATTVTDLTKGEVAYYGSTATTNAGAYTLAQLPAPNTYYVIAFRDANFDQEPNGPEPIGYFGAPGGALADLGDFAQPVFVDVSASAGPANVTLNDTGGIRGEVRLSTSAGGALTLVAGRGSFGAASFEAESGATVPVSSAATAAAGVLYELGLMRSATNYSVFAYHDINSDGAVSPGEPTAQTAPDIAVSSGSMSYLPLTLLAPSAPPASTRFEAVADGPTQITFNWDGVGGATYYALRRADGLVLQIVNAATYYAQAGLSANTSSQIRLLAAGGPNGLGPSVSLSSPIYTLAAAPSGMSAGSFAQSSALLSWSANGNPLGTLYRVGRSTQASRENARVVFEGAQISYTDAGLAAGTPYWWDVAALNANGKESAADTASGQTLAPTGNVLIGTVTYAGLQSGAFILQASTAPDFTGAVSSISLPNLPIQPFTLAVPGSPSYLRAFVDVLGNGPPPAPGADRTPAADSFSFSGSPISTAVAIAVDAVPPAAPAGLVASPGFGSVTLSWAAPTKNSDGSPLLDLKGFVVQRSTGVGAPFASLQPPAAPLSAASFVDLTAEAGKPALYRVLAVDHGRNLSAPTAALQAAPSAGGSISGIVRPFTGSTLGQFRVRLATSPEPTASALKEVSVTSYTFTGLADGSYYLRAYRDLDNNGAERQVSEPAGTYGGLNTPFAVPIVNGNAVTAADVAVCDRVQLFPGSVGGTLSPGGCPARDKGPSNVTQLYAIPVGDGSPGSLGLGTLINLTITTATFGDSELIVLGPDGRVAARDNRPGGASVSLTLDRPGVYLVEPTSFLSGGVGSFTLSLRVDGGFSGVAAGTVTYGGSKLGLVYAQLFDSPAQEAASIAQSTHSLSSNSAFYSFAGLPDGVYYLRAFRDSNGNGVRDGAEPSGQVGFSASSPTAVHVTGGFTSPSSLGIALSDPAVGAVKGTILYDGTQTGSIKVQAGLPACAGCGDIGSVLASASTGAASSYFLDALPAATNYIVRAFVDSNANGRNDVLEPVVSSQNVTVTANSTTTVSAILQDPGAGAAGNAVIAGTIAYAGAATGTVFVGFSRDPSFYSIDIVLQLPATGYFQRSGVRGGATYYMAGFIDSIPNGIPDFQLGEPRGTGGPAGGAGPFLQSAPPMVFVPDFGVTGTSMTIVDPPSGRVKGRVSYAGASAAPIIVQAARMAGAGGASDAVETILSRQAGVADYDYQLSYVAAAPDYFVHAFVDANGNGRPDFGEPFASRSPVAVSSGAGAFPTYGQDLRLGDAGSQGTAKTAGRIRGDVSYLGSQGGDLFVRFFTNAGFSGVPFATVRVDGPVAGPGNFSFDKDGLPLNTTFYLDAFRDPSDSGVYNPTFHARGPLTEGGDGVVLTAERSEARAFGHITDPGEGGSVNVFSGRLDQPAGARFDGGAFDVAAGVVVDSFTAPAPQYVALHVTTQNDGLGSLLVRYSSAGVMLSSRTVGSELDGVSAPAVGGGYVFLASRRESEEGGFFASTAVISRFDPNFGSRQDFEFGVRGFNTIVFSTANGKLYAAGAKPDSSDVLVLEINPANMVVDATGTLSMPAGCGNCGGTGAYGLAVSPDGTRVYTAATSGEQDGHKYQLLFLAKFARGAGPTLTLLGTNDVTGLRLPSEGLGLAADGSGNVFASGVEAGGRSVRTYKFDSALNQAASAELPNVLVHFEGGVGNVQVDASDGHLYQVWESSVNFGDFMALRYDNSLNLMSYATFDGLDNTKEDFPFSLAVYNSSNVVAAGGVNNGRTLDSALIRFNMNAGGASSAPGAAVAVATVQAVSGSLSFAGSQASTSVFRTVLLPAGSQTPIRFATAPYGGSASYLFNNVPYGRYLVRSFLDADGDLLADAAEPVAWSRAGGESFLSGSSYAVAGLALCERSPLGASPVSASFSAADCAAPDRDGAYQRLYTFEARRGEPVSLLLEGVGFQDTHLRLYGPTGDLLLSQDDGGAAGDARISEYIIPQDGLYTVAASPFAPGVTGAFRLTRVSGSGSPGSVSGRVDYSGSQGGTIQVGRFSSPVFSAATSLDRLALTSTRVFTFANVPAGATYYFGAFVDVNANGSPDAGEDGGVFGAAGSPAPVNVQVGQGLTGVVINVAASTASAANASYLTGEVTLTGAPAGALVLEFWSSAQFTGRPVATRQIPTGVGPFDVAVPGGVAYYVRAFLDLDGDFLPDPNEPKGVYSPRGQGAESVFAPAGASVPNVNIALAEPGKGAGGGFSGQGSATLTPSSLAGGVASPLQVTYTAGASGIQPGGQVGFTVPPGFPFPFGVTASDTDPEAGLSAVTVNGPSAFVTVTGAAVDPGFSVTFTWSGFFSPCQAGASTITVVSASSVTVAPSPLLEGSPIFTVGAGSPEFVTVNPPYFSLRSGELSDPVSVEIRDRCGNKVPAGGAKTVELRAKAYNPGSGLFELDESIGLSSAAAVSTKTAISLGFTAALSSRTFYALAASTGFKNLELFANLSFESTFYYGVSVLPADSLTNVRVATTPGGVSGATATIAQSAQGVPNQVFIDFNVGDPSIYWHVLFATSPFKPGVVPTPVWERWGSGQPSLGEIAWDGRYNPWINAGGRVPNGLYYGRVEIGGGGVKDDRIRVTVNVPQLTGRVMDAAVSPNPPLANASLRVYGPSGFFTATTAADGVYKLPGLGAGAYRLNVARQDYVDAAVDLTLDAGGSLLSFTPRSAGVTVSSNAAGGLDVLLGRAPRLVVVPSVDVGISTEPFDRWGSLQVRQSTGSQLETLFGPMRLRAGTTSFDDGGQWDPATQQFVARTQLSFNVPAGSYTVQGELMGFTRSSETVYVGAAGAAVTLAPFQRKSSISGKIALDPNNLTSDLFVSVSAMPLSTAAAAVGGFGSVQLPQGATEAVYVVGGLEPGAYVLRANAPGLSAAATGPILVGANADVTGIDFPGFGAGATLSGTITIGAAEAGKAVFINAWSPGSLNFGSTRVFVTAGGNVGYSLQGLDAGATYQLYANLDSDREHDVPGGFPLKVSPPATLNFTMSAASGAVSGLIRLPAGASDFLNVDLSGVIAASLRPQEVGRQFVYVSTSLPGFLCGGTTALPASGYCGGSMSSATFVVPGLNTQTLDLTFFHRSSGQTLKQRLSVVNGSTATLVADLSAQTFSISGSIVNQVTDALYNTNAKIVSSAPFFAPVGWPAGLSSSTARVIAVRQELESYGVAISTVFDEASSRVGFYNAAGAFTIPNVPNGVYFVRSATLRACNTCEVLVPPAGRLVAVAGASVSSVTLTLSDGYSISGTISLGDEISDWAVFQLDVVNRRQEIVRSTTAYLGDQGLGVFANAVSYRFNNLPAGEFYTLVARDLRASPKYVGRPVKFPDPALSPDGLRSSLTGQDVLMKRAGVIIGRLKDGGTGELIGKSNAGLLAPNFRVTATANPWIEGGFVVAAASVAGRPIQDDGYFRVGPLLPDVSYDLRLAQASWDPSFLQLGSQNYAPITLGGLRLAPGESRDVGVLSLGQGRSITGVVRSTATGQLLGNIKVTARPSFGEASGVLSQSYTNNAGAYTLWVSTAISNQFDLTAAPRDGNKASDGLVYGRVTLRNVNLLSAATADFLLTPLPGSVTGQVVVADAASGGTLAYPFGERRGFPAAAINMQRKGVVSSNPLGDIEAATDERGFFTVSGLSTGTYSLHATGLGYSVFSATAAVSGGSFRIFRGSDTPSNDLPGNVLTLQRGATLTGRILKSDGTAPNASEVRGVAAANFAADEFVVGSVETDPISRTVDAYTISGFRPGVSYDIVLISGDDGKDVSFPVEGDDVLFTAAESTATKTITLTFTPSRLDCLGAARALDAARSQFLVQIDCLKPLRSDTALDFDLGVLMAVSTYTSAGTALSAPNGSGGFLQGSRVMNASRRRLTGVYQTAAGETRFSVRVIASAVDVDPQTGQNFSVDKVFDFFTGLESATDGRVTNIDGGSLSLTPSAQDEQLGLDERGRIDLRPGTFAEGSDSLPDSQAVANPTVTVNVTMTKSRDRQLAQTLFLKSQGYLPASLTAPESGGAYPAETWAAMQAYRTQASTTQVGGANPLSSFYSIFLPLGIRHQLKERADLTLSFNTLVSTAVSADSINVWFYNATLGRYVLENVDRRLDMVNKTITVSVDHFSTFVVLDSTPVLTSDVSFAGTDIIAASFPNPADCITHSNIQRNTSFFAGGVIPPFTGQMIRASLPPGTANELTVNVYNLSGQKVRSMPQGSVPGGQTYYMPWNCANDDGKTVSSGVYFGEIRWGGLRKFIKMAIIKGSGL